jgi:predicted esterase
MVVVVRALAMVCALVTACSACGAPGRTGASDVGRSHGEQPPELEAPRALVALPVAGHNPAVVSVPAGATGRMPVLVATHGAGDRAEWHCEIWRGIVRGRGFVLCPQGRRMDDRIRHEDSLYYYPDHKVLDRELTAALDALGARFPEHADTSGAVYAGFSQGAIFGALIVAQRPDAFPRAILVEGGHGAYQEWNRAAAKSYATRGGKRVFFGCGGPWCDKNARGISALLEKAGAKARVAYAEGAGHTMTGAMEPELRAGFEWVIEDDPRWRQR